MPAMPPHGSSHIRMNRPYDRGFEGSSTRVNVSFCLPDGLHNSNACISMVPYETCGDHRLSGTPSRH